MRRHKPKRKRKNLQCAKRVPNSIENEPTATEDVFSDTPGPTPGQADGKDTVCEQQPPSPGTPGEGRGEGSSSVEAEEMHPLPNLLPEYREREQQALPA